MTWDEYFMDMCDLVATKSKDMSTKVGAVIVGRERKDVRGTGFNGFPRGIFDDASELKNLHEYSSVSSHYARIEKLMLRLERPMKLMVTEHSEKNAIFSSAAVGVPLAGCMMYVNSLPPCHECARAIIQTGIVELVHVEGEVPERWKESCGIGLELMSEAGVIVRTIKRQPKEK